MAFVVASVCISYIHVSNDKMLKIFHCTLRKHNSWTAKIHRSQTQQMVAILVPWSHGLPTPANLVNFSVGNQEAFTLPRKLTLSHLKMGAETKKKRKYTLSIPTVSIFRCENISFRGCRCREVGSLTDENKLIGWTFGTFSTTKTCEESIEG